MLVKGKISPETFEEWNRAAGKAELPERLHPKARAKPKRNVKSKDAPKRRVKSKDATILRRRAFSALDFQSTPHAGTENSCEAPNHALPPPSEEARG